MNLLTALQIFNIICLLSCAPSLRSCSLAFTGGENRTTLLRQAAITCKGPFWPESCATAHPTCPFSQERRSHEAIMESLTSEIPSYDVLNPDASKHRILRCCLECRRTCSHPATCIGLGAFVCTIMTLCGLEHIAGIEVPHSWVIKGASLAAPACGFGFDYCCLTCLTNPGNWDKGPDVYQDQPEVPEISVERNEFDAVDLS